MKRVAPVPVPSRALLRPLALATVLVLLAASCALSIGLAVRDARLLPSAPRTVSFAETSTGGTLVGTFYDNHGPSVLHPVDAGVVLAGGFGFDRGTLRRLALAYARAGFSVLAFDMPGHGASSGKLGFDNASTDRTARAYGDAAAALQRLAGLPPDRIVLAGHSMGARAALQYAASRPVDATPYGGLVLIGASVSLLPADASRPFGAPDDRALDWVARLGPGVPGCPIALLSGAWDDVLTPEGAQVLYERLSGEDARLFPGSSDASAPGSLTWLSADGRTRLTVYPATPHVFETLSPALVARAVDASKRWLGGFAESAYAYAGPLRADPEGLAAWTAAALLLLAGAAATVLVLRDAAPSAAAAATPAPAPSASDAPAPVRPGPYVALRLLLWLPALVLAVLAGAAAFLLPGGLPAINLVYLLLPGAFGLAGLLAARLLPRAYAPLRRPAPLPPFRLLRADGTPHGRALSLLLALPVLALLVAAYFLWAREGWYAALPTGTRLLLTVLLGAFTFPGFLLARREGEALRAAGAGRVVRLALFAVQTLPFTALLVLFALLGSLSGALGAIIGMAALLLAHAASRTALAATGSRAAAAAAAALAFQALLLVQGALLGF